MEHNSVMRPLRKLESQGVDVSVVPCSAQGLLDPADVERTIRPDTQLIVLNHASNVTGTLLPVREVGRIARAHRSLFLVDAAQTAGCFPIDVEADFIDLLGFTGHKALLGPMGTGGLYVGPRVPVERLSSLKEGGTGSRSEFELQPEFLPDKYEGGTLNAVGLAGLQAGVRFVLDQGVGRIREHEVQLASQLIAGLRTLERVRVYGPRDAKQQTATLAFNIEGVEASEVGLRLDEEAGIMCRPGLHCAPSAHKTIGTFPDGTVRFALSYFSTPQEVERAVEAVRAITLGGRA
jgi:cysteine desulfurase/selenocysteine lyase